MEWQPFPGYLDIFLIITLNGNYVVLLVCSLFSLSGLYVVVNVVVVVVVVVASGGGGSGAVLPVPYDNNVATYFLLFPP